MREQQYPFMTVGGPNIRIATTTITVEGLPWRVKLRAVSKGIGKERIWRVMAAARSRKDESVILRSTHEESRNLNLAATLAVQDLLMQLS